MLLFVLGFDKNVVWFLASIAIYEGRARSLVFFVAVCAMRKALTSAVSEARIISGLFSTGSGPVLDIEVPERTCLLH